MGEKELLRQWHLHGMAPDRELDERASLRCTDAWSVAGLGCRDVVVAVVDDGCQLDHPVFGGPSKFIGHAYFDGTRIRFDHNHTSSKLVDGRTHGTSTCALIAGTGEQGTFGVAPHCRLLPIQIRTNQDRVALTDDELLNILDIISLHSDIAVLSWSKSPSLLISKEVYARFSEVASVGGRRKAGVLLFCPAGNSNCPLSLSAKTPLPFAIRPDRAGQHGYAVATTRVFRNMLTEIPNVIHVGAISSLARRSFYSSYGSGLDLCAPSSNSRVFTQLPVPGQRKGLTTSYGRNGEITDNFKGTSGAAALAAGVAALALSASPGLTADELRQILLRTCSKDLDVKDVYADLPDPYPWEVAASAPFDSGIFDTTGWSPWFGFGRVDAYRAVVEAGRFRRHDG